MDRWLRREQCVDDRRYSPSRVALILSPLRFVLRHYYFESARAEFASGAAELSSHPWTRRLTRPAQPPRIQATWDLPAWARGCV